MKWLNNWELNFKNNLIKEEDFLTPNTAEGLRMTIVSTLDIVEYLHKCCDFKYVLTAKMNQDCLEVTYKDNLFLHIKTEFNIYKIMISEIFWNYTASSGS